MHYGQSVGRFLPHNCHEVVQTSDAIYMMNKDMRSPKNYNYPTAQSAPSEVENSVDLIIDRIFQQQYGL